MGRGRDKREDAEANAFEEGPSLPALILFPANPGGCPEGDEGDDDDDDEEDEEGGGPGTLRGGVFSEGRESTLLSLAGLVSLVSRGATGW